MLITKLRQFRARSDFIYEFIRQCKTIKQLHQIHAHTIKSAHLSHRYSSSFHVLPEILYALTILASTAASTYLLHYAGILFSSISNPSTFSYNSVIRAHTLLSSPLRALHFFARMRRSSVPLDFYSLPFALKACAQLRSLQLARCFHSLALKSGFATELFVMNSLICIYSRYELLGDAYRLFDGSSHRDVVSYNALIDGYVKAGDIDGARALFDRMPMRDAVSWGTMITGCAHGNRCEEAIELFSAMMDLELKPDSIALVSTLSACAQLGELEKGKMVHEYVEKNAIELNSFLSTGLVHFYAKCGCIDAAIQIFESSPDNNLFTWNAMLVALAMHGQGQLLLDYFARMIRAGVEPDGVSILGVLAGCSHGGLVDEARIIFEEMESAYGVPREPKHYGCMADLLGRAGLIKDAMAMIKDMPTDSNLSVWSGLLGGCRIHGHVEIAEKAAKHVMELKPEDGGVYSILANVYANAERWEDVINIRKSLSGNRGVKKNAACSSIQLEGVIHEFLSGDSSHPQSDDIYLLLSGIKEHQCEM